MKQLIKFWRFICDRCGEETCVDVPKRRAPWGLYMCLKCAGTAAMYNERINKVMLSLRPSDSTLNDEGGNTG